MAFSFNRSMARTDMTADDFDRLSADLVNCASKLRDIAASMRKSEIPSALVHGSTAKNIYIPSLMDWIDKTGADINTQIRSYLSGVPSNAELMKRQTENQKLAAAKKPAKKKTS